jgi:hypothetical protein
MGGPDAPLPHNLVMSMGSAQHHAPRRRAGVCDHEHRGQGACPRARLWMQEPALRQAGPHRMAGFCRLMWAYHHRRTATPAQTASTSPNGHAPCKKPYAEPSPHEKANAKMNHELRCSSA